MPTPLLHSLTHYFDPPSLTSATILITERESSFTDRVPSLPPCSFYMHAPPDDAFDALSPRDDAFVRSSHPLVLELGNHNPVSSCDTRSRATFDDGT